MRYSELDKAEAAVRKEREVALAAFSEPLVFADIHLRLAASEAEARSGSDKSCACHASLLERIADDLRATWVLATAGYAHQAVTLAASVFEIGYTAAYIGQSESRAAEWLAWQNYKNVPWRAKHEYLRGGLANWFDRAVTDDEVAGHHRWYVALCMYKHSNPMIQARAPLHLTPEQHVVGSSPIVEPGSLKQCRAALYLGYQAAFAAMVVVRDLLASRFATEEQWTTYIETLFGHYRGLTSAMFPS